MTIKLKFSKRYEMVFFSTWSSDIVFIITLLLLMWNGVAVGKQALVSSTRLKDVFVQKMPGDNVKIVLNFSDLPKIPKTFMIDDPPELILDFINTSNELPRDKMFQKLSLNLVESVLIANNRNKLRVIVALHGSVPYTSEIDGNNLVLTIKNEEAKTLNSIEENTINALDFNRSSNGEGQLVLDVRSRDVITNVKDLDKNNMLIEFKNATISNNLLRKFEVGDFGTPVKNIVISRKNKSIFVKVCSLGEHEKISYHVEGKYIVEVRPKMLSEQQNNKARKFKFTGEKISLNFQDIEIRAVLQLLADFTGLNIVASDNVTGNVTLRLESIPWDEALDFILKSKGLSKRDSGNIILIAPSQELSRYEEVEATSLKQLETLAPLRTELLQINYAKAEDLLNIIKGNEKNSMLSSKGTATIDARTNTILLKDIDDKINDIKELIISLDTPVKQVLIEAYIVTADQDFQDLLGIKFGGAATGKVGKYRFGLAPTPATAGGAAAGGSTTGGATAGGATAVSDAAGNAKRILSDGINSAASGSFFNFASGAKGVMGIALSGLPAGTLLNLELDAAEKESLTTIISKPKILTMNNQSASIESGQDIPYTTTTANNGSNTMFQKAVLKLEVTPKITPNDQISMDLNITNDSPVGAAGSDKAPISTTSLKTNVLVGNGETIILGGIFTDTIQDTKEKIPYLSDLPLLGKLFQNKVIKDTKKELLIFITPRIVEDLSYN